MNPNKYSTDHYLRGMEVIERALTQRFSRLNASRHSFPLLADTLNVQNIILSHFICNAV